MSIIMLAQGKSSTFLLILYSRDRFWLARFILETMEEIKLICIRYSRFCCLKSCMFSTKRLTQLCVLQYLEIYASICFLFNWMFPSE